jgi:hypothetical protein
MCGLSFSGKTTLARRYRVDEDIDVWLDELQRLVAA